MGKGSHFEVPYVYDIHHTSSLASFCGEIGMRHHSCHDTGQIPCINGVASARLTQPGAASLCSECKDSEDGKVMYVVTRTSVSVMYKTCQGLLFNAQRDSINDTCRFGQQRVVMGGAK